MQLRVKFFIRLNSKILLCSQVFACLTKILVPRNIRAVYGGPRRGAQHSIINFILIAAAD